MALQIRRGTNAERLGITLVEGEVVYVTDFELATIEVTSINATTNVLTTTLNHGLSVNDQIKFQSATGNGLTNDQVYYVKTIPSQVEFTLSTSLGGSTLDITGTAASLIFATGPTNGAGTPYGYSISPLYVGDGVTAGGNPAGASILDDLYDVSIGVYGNVGQYGEALADNNLLQYNSTTDQWENRANLTVNGNISATGDLTLNSDLGSNDVFVQFTSGRRLKWDHADQRFEFDSGDLWVGGDLTVNGNDIKSSSATAITLSGSNVTVAGTLEVDGNQIKNSSGQTIITFSGNNTLLSGDLEVQGQDIKSNGGTTAISLSGADVTVAGNLTVNGTTTTVNSTTLTVDDKNIELASTASPSDATADGGGITLKGNSDKKIFWQNSDDRWYIDNGDGNNYLIPVNLTDLNDVAITSANKGQVLYYDGTGWVNTSAIQFDSTAYRPRFQSNSTTSGTISSGLITVKNTGATAYTNGDGSGIVIAVDDDSNPINVFAGLNAAYNSAGNHEIRLRSSTDNFVTVDKTLLAVNDDDLKIRGTEFILNATGTGSAAVDAQITVERGTTGADSYIRWNETDDIWVASNTLYVDNAVIGGTSIATNGNDIYFNNDDGGTGATSTITVKRGSNADVALRWNETDDRWETTTDGTNYITIPNQGLDTGNSPSFLGVTGGNVRVGVTGDNEIDTSTGNLTIDSAGGTTTIDDAVIINDNLSVLGTTTLGNASGDTVNLVAGTVNIGTTVTTTVTVGDAATDTLTVNATSTFNNNTTLGSSDADTLTVNATADFKNNVTIGSDTSDVLLVKSTVDFTGSNVNFGPGAENVTVTVGNNSTDELYVNATAYINNNLTIGSTSGDTLTVNSLVGSSIEFKDSTATVRGIRGTVGTNDTWFVGAYAATTNDGQLIIATADDGTEPIYVRQYSGTILSGTVANQLTLLDGSGNTSIPNDLTVGANVNCSQVTVDSTATYNTETTTTTSTSTVNISSTTRTTQKVVITITDSVSGEMHVLEALAFRKGTTAYLTTYGEMYSNAALATFTADVNAGSIRILATPASTNSTTFKVARVSVD